MLVAILSGSVVVEVFELGDLVLVLLLLFLESMDFVFEVVDLLSEREALITLLGDITLRASNFHVLAVDLVPESGDLILHVSVASVLVVEHESEIVKLLLQAVELSHVSVVLRPEVVVLQELLVLKVSVLRLDVHELVLHGEEVLVSLLDLEDLSLQL